MALNFPACLTFTLREEGGFVDDPQDPGGMTNLGIDELTMSHWLHRPVTRAEMQALTVADVTPIYLAQFWNVIRGGDLPLGLDLCVFDFGVNSGPGHAVKDLQRILQATPDGAIGPATLLAVNGFIANHGVGPLIQSYEVGRLAFDQAQPTWDHFGAGWSARVARVTVAAKAMAHI